MKQSFAVFVIALSACIISSASAALEIQNFKSGLVCPYQSDMPDEQSPNSRICFKVETVHITGQGRCVYDGKEERCTWYGYEFDYTNATANDEVSCVSTGSRVGDIGSPKGIDKKDTATFEYSINLSPGNGHHYNPQYSIFAFSMDDEPTDNEETVCSIEGQELFRFRFQFVYPKLD